MFGGSVAWEWKLTWTVLACLLHSIYKDRQFAKLVANAEAEITVVVV